MNQITSVLKMHYKDKWTWLIIPGIILFSSFVVNYIVGLFVQESIKTGGLSSIYVYMFVAGIISLAQMFPFALGFSVRRTDFFWGTVLTVALTSLGWTVLLLLLAFVERFTGEWGVNLHFFTVPYLTDGTAIEQLCIFFIVMVHLYFLGFLISSVYQRFGRNGMFLFFIALFLLLTVWAYVMTSYEWWLDIFQWLSRYTAFELALWLVPLVALYMLVSYVLLRRATV